MEESEDVLCRNHDPQNKRKMVEGDAWFCEMLQNNFGRSSVHQHWIDARGQTQHWPPADLSAPFFTSSVSNFNFYLFAWVLFALLWGSLCKGENFLFTFCMRNHLQPIALSENLDLKTLQIIFFSCITLGVISNKLCHFSPQQSFGCPSLSKILPVTVGQAFISSSLPKLHFSLQRNAAWN